MTRHEKRNFWILVLVVIAVQVPDYILHVPDEPWWWLYLCNAFVDSIAFLIIYSFLNKKHSPLALSIMILQLLSVGASFIAWSAYLTYDIYKIEIYADLHNLYSPVLNVILWLKVIVLGYGGYGIYRRKRSRHIARDNYTPAIILSDRYIAQRNQEMVD